MLETLVLHLGALGDFVLSWPALGRLAVGPPSSDLTLLGQPTWARLILPAHRALNRESSCFNGLFSTEPGPQLRTWLQEFDRAVVFAHRPDPLLLDNLQNSVPQVWTVPTHPSPQNRRYAGEVQMAALADLGLSAPARPFPLLLELPVVCCGLSVLAPGSGSRAKRLDPVLAGRLAKDLAWSWGPPLLLLGPAEDEAYRQELWQTVGETAAVWLQDPEMSALAAALLAAPVYVGADSGVSHLAAALGVPTLAIFQASDPLVWAPRGKRARACWLWELEETLSSGRGLVRLMSSILS